MMINIVKY